MIVSIIICKVRYIRMHLAWRTAMTAARLDAAYALRGGLALLGANRFALLAANRLFTDC
jgi:hypothetical protein